MTKKEIIYNLEGWVAIIIQETLKQSKKDYCDPYPTDLSTIAYEIFNDFKDRNFWNLKR